MTTSWGGTSIPDPTKITRRPAAQIVQFTTIDNVLHTDQSGTTQYEYNLAWENITKAEHDTIHGKAITYSSATVVLPVWGTITATPIANSVNSDTTPGASGKVSLSCAIRTA